MKNELTDVINNHVIIFMDGSKKFITEKTAIRIKQLPVEATKIAIGGDEYKLHQIVKLINIEEYYEQYPDQKSQEVKNFSSVGDFTKIHKTSSKKARSGIIKGLQQFRNENKEAEKAMIMLNKFKQYDC